MRFSRRLRKELRESNWPVNLAGLSLMENLVSKQEEQLSSRFLPLPEHSPFASDPLTSDMFWLITGILARSVGLLKGYIAAANEGNPHSLFLNARAEMETAALVVYLSLAAETFEKDKNLEVFREAVSRCMFGGRIVGNIRSVNALTLVKHTKKWFVERGAIVDWEEWYERLSEYCHPNFSAVTGLHFHRIGDYVTSGHYEYRWNEPLHPDHLDHSMLPVISAGSAVLERTSTLTDWLDRRVSA